MSPEAAEVCVKGSLIRQIPRRPPHPDPVFDRWETKLQEG